MIKLKHIKHFFLICDAICKNPVECRKMQNLVFGLNL